MGTIRSKIKRRSSEAKEVLKELQNFPVVTKENPNLLWKFSVVCMQAKSLASTEQGRTLAVLDFPDIQKTVTGRLGTRLRDRWSTKYGKLSAASEDGSVPFCQFCDWMASVTHESSLDGIQFDDSSAMGIKPQG